METLVDDNKKVEVSSIDQLLSGYTSPLSVSSNPSNGSNPGTPVMNPGLSKPLNDTLNQAQQQFYKTGKKAGQPKPNRGATPYPKQPVPGSQSIQPGAPIQNQLISGALFLTLIDLVLPLAITFINNQFSKVKIEASKLKLKDEQRKDMEPLCNEVVKYLNIQANPVLLLTISLGGLYAMNFMLMKMEAEAKQAISKTTYDK